MRAAFSRRGGRSAQARAPALRIAVPEESVSFTDGHLGHFSQNLARECGDFILRRSDGIYAYQLAVAVDDARMGVTQVVRGQDLLSSTPRQIFCSGCWACPRRNTTICRCW